MAYFWNKTGNTFPSVAGVPALVTEDDLYGCCGWPVGAAGNNTEGELGNTDRSTVPSWKYYAATRRLGPNLVDHVSAGIYHAVAAMKAGTLMSWGDNTYGQLADGSTTIRRNPISSSISDVFMARAASNFTVVLKDDGTVWCVGANTVGQLGQGSADSNPHTSFLQVSSLSDVTYIGCGWGHTIAVKSDGTAYAWGLGGAGQLGDGGNSNQYSPVQMYIGGSPIADAVAAWGGYQHTLVLRSNGDLYVCGNGGYGQLGIGVQEYRNTLVKMDNVSNVVMAGGGEYNSYILDSSGNVWSCGLTSRTGNGNDTPTYTLSPVVVLTGATFVTAGAQFGACVKSDKSIWSWGDNGSGQLADKSTTSRLSPVASVVYDDDPVSNIASLSGGYGFCLSLKEDTE